MHTRLVADPIWLEPDESLLKMAGRRLLIITPLGERVEFVISIVPSESDPLRYAVKINNEGRCYLTAEAVKMIQPMKADELHHEHIKQTGPELLLNFAV